LACKEIYLIDDRRSAVSLPEVPYLGVLPGTGGLTRVVDKRMVRRDLADIFSTLAEGVKGKRAKKWRLVDDVFPTSQFQAKVAERAQEIAGAGRPERKGVTLDPLSFTVEEDSIQYQHTSLSFDHAARTATLTVTVPDSIGDIPEDPSSLGCNWYPLAVFREIDDAVLRLRFHYPEIGLVILQTRGNVETLLQMDSQLAARSSHWFVNEVVHFIKRVLKRIDVSAKSFFALIEEGSCYAGTFLELALAADRSYMLEEDGITIALSDMNSGPYPMGNGLTRLQSRFLADPEHATTVAAMRDAIEPYDADELGMVTAVYDDIDWEDEIRLVVEERASLSPDALTGMEASLRFAGPETLETKIFGRLSAWQNWIFQRPNAVGKRGALTLYGQPETAELDYRRT